MSDTERTDTDPAPTTPPAIESATASTACQTNASNFSYILTGCILGVVALVAGAVVVLVFAIASSNAGSYSQYGLGDGLGLNLDLGDGLGLGDGYSDEDGDDGSADGYGYDDDGTYGFNYESGFSA